MDVQGQWRGYERSYGQSRGHGSFSGPIARGSYAIRDRRIVRQASYAPVEPEPVLQVDNEYAQSPGQSANNRKLAFIAVGVVFGIIGLSGLAYALSGDSEPPVIASRPAAVSADEETAYTVEDTSKQASADVLGASSTAPAPSPAPSATSRTSTTSRSNIRSTVGQAPPATPSVVAPSAAPAPVVDTAPAAETPPESVAPEPLPVVAPPDPPAPDAEPAPETGTPPADEADM